jgi:hypothetical protein
MEYPHFLIKPLAPTFLGIAALHMR